MNIKIKYDTVSFASQIQFNDKIIENNLKQSIEENKNKRITDWFESFIERVKEESNNDKFSIEISGCDIYEMDLIESILEKENNFISKKKIVFVKDNIIKERYNAIDDFIDYSLNSKETILEEAIKPNIVSIEYLRSNIVEVPVIATMSSGKSTLLNSLIGQNFLFEDTGAATATT